MYLMCFLLWLVDNADSSRVRCALFFLKSLAFVKRSQLINCFDATLLTVDEIITIGFSLILQ